MLAVLGLAVVAALLSILGIHVVALVPALGPRVLRRLTEARALLAALALVCGAWLLSAGAPALGAVALGLGTLAAALTALLRGPTIFAALDGVRHAAPGEAGLPGSTEVIGLAHEDQAVAYPIWEMVAPRHLVHDTVGGLPVLATYCPACRTGVVFSRRSGRRTLTFQVAGLWRKNMVMRDRETGTLWQQASGEALLGPLAGRSLEVLFGEQSTLDGFVAEHPGATVALVPPDARGSLFTSRMGLLRDLPARFAPAGMHARDDRLAPHTEVIGVVAGDEAWAFPLETLRGAEARVTVAGLPLVVTYDAVAGRVTARFGEARVRTSREWWHAWSEYHPGTRLFTP